MIQLIIALVIIIGIVVYVSAPLLSKEESKRSHKGKKRDLYMKKNMRLSLH